MDSKAPQPIPPVFTKGDAVTTPGGEAVVHNYPMDNAPDHVEVEFASGAPFTYYHVRDVSLREASDG